MKRKEALKNLLLGLGAIGLSPATARGEAMTANEATRQKDDTFKTQSKALRQSEPGVISSLPGIVLNEERSVPTSLASVFSADPMNINLIGTRGSQWVKHEGRGGWTTADYYGRERLLYIFDVTGMNINPSIGAVYSSGKVNFTVTEVNISAGKGYISCTGNQAPSAFITLPP